MNPYTAYLFFRRTFRAFKVLWLLFRRRDLVRELPTGYLKEMATSNRWLQLQMVGVVAFLFVPITALLPESISINAFLIALLVGIIAMWTRFFRWTARTVTNRN